MEGNPFDYSFVNRDGINYHLYFTPISSIYPDLVNTYSFSIEREGTNPHPLDLRIAATVVEVLRRFFQNVENAMIMVCDSTDGKKDNPYKQQLIKAFGDLLARDCFEIVI